jgi:hypothetical protein
MAMTLDATLAGEHSNSYVTVVYCDDYWTQHFATAKAAQWAALTTGRKEALLIMACRVLERVRCTYPAPSRYNSPRPLHLDRSSGLVVEYPDYSRPVKSSVIQALQFPRNIDRENGSSTLFIPEAVMMAQCEQALYLLNFDDSILASRMQGVTSDSLEIPGVGIKQSLSGTGSALAPMALEYLAPFIQRTGTVLRRG